MDPKVWANRLTERLFQRDSTRLERVRDDLVEANHREGGNPEGFLFGGKFHTTLPISQQVRVPKKLAEPAMHFAAQDYLDDCRTTTREQIRVRQGIHTLLLSCKTEQDVRDALPEVVIPLLPELGLLNRTRPAGWMYINSPLHQVTYEQTVTLLEFYTCNQLLY